MKNLVWICTDQQRGDSLGCTGNQFAETPTLDKLAGEGTLITRLMSPHPVCMPSRASMLTGQHVPRHGVISNGIALAERGPDDVLGKSHVTTIAHHLRDHGYDTSCIGKLHLEPHLAPLHYRRRESYAMWEAGENESWNGPLYGFNRLELTERHGAQAGGRYLRWLQRMDPDAARRLTDPEKTEWPIPPTTIDDLRPAPIDPELSATMWTANSFDAFLSSRGAENDPFFAWIGIPDPHHPWHPPKELADRFASRGFSSPIRKKRKDPPSWWEQDNKPNAMIAGRPDEDLCAAMVRQYTDAQIALVDRAVEQILDSLRAKGLLENTVVCFVSDHGDFLGDYGRIRKMGYACGSLSHVPAIIRDPDHSLPDRIDAVCGGVDLAPTLCRAIGVPWSVPDGTELQSGSPGRAFSFCLQDLDQLGGNQLTVWTDTERYSYQPMSGEREYYDHSTDPQELSNESSAQHSRCAELHDELVEEYLSCSKPNVARLSQW